MKKKNLLSVALVLAIGAVVLMTSCSKGSAGPAGPAGAVGPAGPDSVMYSGWITLNTPYSGNIDASTGDSIFSGSITAAAITSQVLNQDQIVGYLLVGDPVTGDSSIINAATAFQEFFTVGYIDILSYGNNWTGGSYRYVIVPGKISVTSATGAVQTYTANQMKAMSYTQLTSLLGIPAKGSTIGNTGNSFK